MEMQGIYNDIMKSGIDISSMMKQNEGEESEANAETMKSASSLSGENVKSSEVINDEKRPSEVDNKDESDEKNQLLKELEASSKGKVKESVLWSYLMSANQPFTLIFLITSILLTQILASLTDVWISYW